MTHNSTTVLSSTPVKRRGGQHTIWTREKIYKLIELYRASECLWNHYSELYKNKSCRNKAINRICTALEISKIDYGKKVHNLRNQFNSELKKYEARLEKTGGKKVVSPKTRRWEHFETLMFLRPFIEPRPGYHQPQIKKVVKRHRISTFNDNTEPQLSTIENQLEDIIQLQILSCKDTTDANAKEQGTCEVQRSCSSIKTYSCSPSFIQSGGQSCVALSESRHSSLRDQWDSFGELIANELRNLKSSISRKKLKRKIMQVMLEVGEEDDKE
ncbi:uncharacterized protein [Drosophila virilis]|uniref:Uncharacterized protein, isoform A n=1 Tax=Drosophila virilis TaxID=7244 RepID=B4MCI5_DROVI|nr:uncharacterized protein LOC6635395 isoform X2 [Drosophila virilis]EDW71373.1 uncharacterized protein Dvir_GJ19741, isoform A [Drosophila virilis]